jgi:uncharacterized protein (TIGR03086 family)
MDVREVFGRAADGFAARVRAVGEDAWSGPTPCEGWDVRALVAHVDEELCWVPPLLAGTTIGDVGDRFAGDLLGEDPAGAVADAAAEATAFATAADLDAEVHVSFGDIPVDEYLWQVAADLLVHGWDVARATGGDERLPDDLVAAVSSWFTANEEGYREAGMVGPRPDVPADADPQTRLLAAFGRRA